MKNGDRLNKNIKCPTQSSLPPITLLSHDRSGSSWIGEILGTAPGIIYRHEPLNPKSGFNGFWAGWRRWLPEGKEDAFFEQVFDPVFLGKIPKVNSFRKRLFLLCKRFSTIPYRIVVKEVGGVLAGEFFEDRYGSKIVVLVRHPAAVASSALKQNVQNAKKWQKSILEQPYLLSAFPGLAPLDNCAEGNDILMLREIAAVYHILHKQTCQNGWIVIFYEDFCENATYQFSKLFRLLRLDFSEKVKMLILEKSLGEVAGQYSTQKDSKRMINHWRKNFSEETIKQMFNAYREFDVPWYSSEDSW